MKPEESPSHVSDMLAQAFKNRRSLYDSILRRPPLTPIQSSTKTSEPEIKYDRHRPAPTPPEPVQDNGPRFWDAVVLIAFNEEQEFYFEREIRKKQSLGRIPTCCRYHVIRPDEFSNIGTGGATLFALKELSKVYGKEDLVDKLKTLLIHQYSDSLHILPHRAATGVYWTLLPTEPEPLDLFEIQLITYCEYVNHMIPGIFITCSDDIQLFYTPNKKYDLTNSGITALAHPKSSKFALNSGVFVVDGTLLHRVKTKLVQGYGITFPCKRFLYKSSIGKLKTVEGSLFRDEKGEEVCFVQSSYFMCGATIQIFLKLYSEISKRPNESNMFADFLGTLGESPDIEHFINTAPTTSGATAMIQRKTIANFFRNCTSNETLPNLRVLVLNLSHTYSLGSMSDYLFTLCENKYFRWELGIQNAASSGMKVAKSIKHKLKRSLRPATMGRENFSHTFQREIRFPQINGIAKAADSANLSIQSETNCAEEWEPASEAAAVIAESSYLISCKIQGHEPPNYGILQPQKFPWAPKRAQTAPILSNNKIEVNLPTEHRKFIVGQSSILEKCTVDLRTESLLQKTADKETIQIGSYCIVSDCDLKIPSIFQNFAYPDGLCLFLTKVSNGHVPIFFGTSVNIKQDHLQLSELYLIDNVPLSFFIRIWETLVSQEVVNQYHKLSILLEEESKGIKRDMDDSLEQDSFSIYTLQLFPVFREATEAREFALNSIESISRFLALEQIERSEILGDNEKLRQEYSVENKEFLQLISLADAIKNAVLS